MKKLYFISVVLVLTGLTEPSKEIFELTTRLDDTRFRFLFHSFRNFVFKTIGQTGKKTTGKFLQEKFPHNLNFPCDLSLGISKDRPTSIHKLRVGGKKKSKL
jgi:hypothetical protein